MLCFEMECLQDTMVINGLGVEENFFWYIKRRKMNSRPLMHVFRRSKTFNMLRFWLTTFHIILHDIYTQFLFILKSLMHVPPISKFVSYMSY